VQPAVGDCLAGRQSSLEANVTKRKPMSKSRRSQRRPRKLGTLGATLALLFLPLGLSTGCEDQVQKEFITAALGSFESGLNSFFDGIVSGLAAVAEQDLEGNSGSQEESTETTTE
jgi:hypothetical protein